MEKFNQEMLQKNEEISFLKNIITSLKEDVKSANEQACYYMCEKFRLENEILKEGWYSMTIGQEIILYFEIIPLLLILIYGVIKSYIEKERDFKRKIWKLKKAYRKQQEYYERKEYIAKLRAGVLIDSKYV